MSGKSMSWFAIFKNESAPSTRANDDGQCVDWASSRPEQGLSAGPTGLVGDLQA